MIIPAIVTGPPDPPSALAQTPTVDDGDSPQPDPAGGLLAAALAYAAAGLGVLPLHTPSRWGCSCPRATACPAPGKHPRSRHGLHEASADPAVIRSWWRRWPRANLGLITGGTLDVCDVDTPAGLRAVLTILDAARPPGPVVRTGFGWHLWFAATGSGNRVGFLPGVDWRGRGGYVIAPPSRHARGRRYRFLQPWTRVPPECPPALRRLLMPPPRRVAPTPGIIVADRYVHAALNGEIRRILAAPRPVIRHGRRVTAGGRNTALHLAAFRLGQLADRTGLDERRVTDHLAEAANLVGLPATEARATIRSGWRAGRRHPRPPPSVTGISPDRPAPAPRTRTRAAGTRRARRRVPIGIHRGRTTDQVPAPAVGQRRRPYSRAAGHWVDPESAHRW